MRSCSTHASLTQACTWQLYHGVGARVGAPGLRHRGRTPALYTGGPARFLKSMSQHGCHIAALAVRGESSAQRRRCTRATRLGTRRPVLNCPCALRRPPCALYARLWEAQNTLWLSPALIRVPTHGRASALRNPPEPGRPATHRAPLAPDTGPRAAAALQRVARLSRPRSRPDCARAAPTPRPTRPPPRSPQPAPPATRRRCTRPA
mmetsp:Transcript_72652/g.199248  ORF Transcript_72652/g.199248 Transcript_72652/m.199248 type:complete len:206 (+) Transcript_72652:128-745(+)